MKYSFSIVVLTFLFISCSEQDSKSNNDSNPLTTNGPSGLEIAVKLKQWSDMQPQKFIICNHGDTATGKLYDQGDLVTNLVLNTVNIYWIFEDSLHIDSTNANGMNYRFSNNERETAYNSLSLSSTESEIINVISVLGYKLRMMDVDTLTNTLCIKLAEWANHQYPPQMIWSGFHSFVIEGLSAHGYSPAVYSYRGAQCLQYFTRNINQAELQNIVSQVDTSLSSNELKNIMLPIAEIIYHDTSLYE